MTPRRPGTGTASIVAAVFIVSVLAVSGLMFLMPTAGNSSTTESSTSPGSSAVYQVIETNLTLRGQAAVVPCVGFNEGVCPSLSNATLHPVDLIAYGGAYYYLYNKTEESPCCGVISNVTATITIPLTYATYTTWFTNSSVFCISPAHPFTNTEHQNRTCPTGPYHTITYTIPVSSTSTLSRALGLRLDLALSSNSSGIDVAVDEFNVLDHVSNITAADRWAIDPSDLFLWIQDGCGPPVYFPVGYAILQGNYSLDNFTTGAPLVLDVQPLIFCPVGPAPTPYFAFEPLSDVALTYQWANFTSLEGVYNVTVNTACHWSSGSGCDLSAAGPWSGYWTGSSSLQGQNARGGACSPQAGLEACPLEFNEFPKGVYTVVAADEWGQVVLLHFTVNVSN